MNLSEPTSGGGSGGDETTDDSTTEGDGGGSGSSGGGSGSGGLPGWGTIAPEWLTSNTSLVQAFVRNPRNFIVGAVLTTILEAVTGAVTTAVDQIILLVGGSKPTRFNAPGETLGLADVPAFVASTLAGAGSFGGQVILEGIESFNATLFDAAAAAGPLAPLVVIVIASAEAALVIVVLRRLVYVAADLLQLGGLTE